MSYPQGFVFQPPASLALPFGSGLVLGTRTDESGRCSSGSAFAAYTGPATSPGFGSHLPYGAEPRCSMLSLGFDPSSSVSSSLDYHPFGAMGPNPYGDPTYRKNATRDATAMLKAWLAEHRKNPYPTKSEKIMLAIVTKMSLTQVSTWFANARRRLKKENKMTWTPRNRSEDEEEEDNVDLERNDEDEETKMNEDKQDDKAEAADHCPSLTYRDDANPSFIQHPDLEAPGPASARLPAPDVPLRGSGPEHRDSCVAIQGSNPAPKPKLWSVAEIATSSDKNKACSELPQSIGVPFTHGPALPRHLYYSSPFIPGYYSYGPPGALHGSPETLSV